MEPIGSLKKLMQNQDDDHSNLQIISKKILSKLHKGDEGISPEFSPEEFLNVNLSDDSDGNLK